MLSRQQQEPLSASLELPLRAWAPMTIGLSFHWPGADQLSRTTYVELPVHRKAILKPSSAVFPASLLSTRKPMPLPLSHQHTQDSPTRILSSRSNVLWKKDVKDRGHEAWEPLEKPKPRTSGKRDLQVKNQPETREQTGLPLHPHLVRIYKIVYTPTAWTSYEVPDDISATITCYAYPKLSAEEKGTEMDGITRIGRWFRGSRREERISWRLDDGEIDFEDRWGRWFLQGREVEEWECRDW